MLRSFTQGFMVIGLTSSLLVGCGPQEALRVAEQLPAPAAPSQPDENVTPPTQPPSQSPSQPSTDEQILAQYDHFDPNHLINTKLLRAATLYFHKNKSKFKNQKALTIIDFSLSSSKKRFYLMNVSTGEVWATYTSHGKGSDSNHDGFAERFSNTSGSNATSLGAYRTAETYSGAHGYSLRLDGLSSTNSNARSRAIVVHGASYVQDESRVQGRSLGCPALAMKYYEKVIDSIKGGSLMYAGASAQL